MYPMYPIVQLKYSESLPWSSISVHYVTLLGIIMDSLRSRGLQSSPNMVRQPRVNNDDQPLHRAPPQLSATLSCYVQGLTSFCYPVAWVPLPPSPFSFRGLCLSCCALSPGCPQPHFSSIVSAVRP